MAVTIDLRECGVADLDVPAESVDAIITDPPYPREFLPQWGELGVFAAHALRPGGSLLAMSGQMFLPDVFRHLEVSGLDYRWPLACMTPGANMRVWPVKLMQGWKPILWYSKGKKDVFPRRMMEDRIVSKPDKRFHHWGQDLGVFEHLVLAFSRRGETVCDPFLGGGTTAVAARLLGRNFLGCDPDAACLDKTRLRIDACDDYFAALGTEPVAAADE